MTGSADFIGKTLDLSGLNIKAQYYREYGLGFSKNITEKLRIGAKVKLLSGIASSSLDSRSFAIKVITDSTLTVTPDSYLNISGKETLNRVFTNNKILGGSDSTATGDFKGFIFDYLKMPLSNFGLGLDIGAVYNLNKYLSFSASVTDIGYISWKHDLKSYYSNKPYNMKGYSLKYLINHPDFSIENFIDSLTKVIEGNYRDTVPKTFKTYLPMGVSAGISINPLPFLSLGVLSNTKFFAGTVREAVTLSANAYVGRIVTASLSYTMANYTYNNLGFGLGFKTGSIFQFYVIADKIPLDWGKVYIRKNNGDLSPAIPVPQK
jgi:hypothetical protein